MKTSLTQFVAVLAFLLGACAQSETRQNFFVQDHQQKIKPDEAMSIVVNHYRHCRQSDQKGDCADWSPGTLAQDFEHCVTVSLLKEQPKLDVLSSKEFRRITFPDNVFASSPPTPEAINELLRDQDLRRRLNAAHLRYLVIVDVQTTKGTNKALAAAGIALGVVAGMHWKSTITASIVDLRDGVQSGVATGNYAGSNWVPTFGLLLPLAMPGMPPMRPMGPKESQACSEFGQTLGQNFYITSESVQARE